MLVDGSSVVVFTWLFSSMDIVDISLDRAFFFEDSALEIGVSRSKGRVSLQATPHPYRGAAG